MSDETRPLFDMVEAQSRAAREATRIMRAILTPSAEEAASSPATPT